MVTHEETLEITNHKTWEKVQVPENSKNGEISINYVIMGTRWKRKQIVFDNIFAHNIPLNILEESEDVEPLSKNVNMQNDWQQWKAVIQEELNSLVKHEVFGTVVWTPKVLKPVSTNGYLCKEKMRKMSS